jgi:hypothetical protein
MYGELPEIVTTNNAGESVTVNAFPVSILNPAKVAILRLPTYEELMTYLSAHKSIYRNLGRGKGRAETVPAPLANRVLFDKLRMDKSGEAFDDDEATSAINQLTRIKLVSCERDGQAYNVSLMTALGLTTHTLSIPFERDAAAYYRGWLVITDGQHGIEERRTPPEVPCKLYDTIVTATTGYVTGSAVPPHHKREVVASVLAEIAALDPGLDPNS